MVGKAIKRQILMKLIKPIFEDIGTGFSSRRPKGTQHIKGEEERNQFTKEYIEQDEESLKEYVKLRAEQLGTLENDTKEAENVVIEKSDPTKDSVDVNVKMPDPILIEPTEKDEATLETERLESVLTEIKDILEGVKDNTKPMSFKEKVLAKKEDDSDDKAMQDLIEQLKENNDKQDVNVTDSDKGSLLGDLIGGAMGGDSGVDIGIDPDFDNDRKRKKPKAGGKRGIFRRAKDFVTDRKTSVMGKVGNIASKGAGLLATGGRALAGVAMANPVGATVAVGSALAYGGYKLWDNMRGEEDDKKVFDQLADEGVIDHDIIGNSEILDWERVKKLKPEILEKLIGYDDFSDKDTDKLKDILAKKRDKKKIQKVTDLKKKEKDTRKESLKTEMKKIYGEKVNVNEKIAQHTAELRKDKSFDFDSLSVEEKSELITKQAFLKMGKQYKGSHTTSTTDSASVIKPVALSSFAKPKDEIIVTKNKKQNLEPKKPQIAIKKDEEPKERGIVYNGVNVKLTDEQFEKMPKDSFEQIDYIEKIALKQQEVKNMNQGSNQSKANKKASNQSVSVPQLNDEGEPEKKGFFKKLFGGLFGGRKKDTRRVKLSDMAVSPVSKGINRNMALGDTSFKKVPYKVKNVNPKIGSSAVKDYKLKDIFKFGKAVNVKKLEGLNKNMLHNLKAMGLEYLDKYGQKMQINSAFRDPKYQAMLFKRALKKYGSYAKARKMVAPPGRSMHNQGLAVDISTHHLDRAVKSGLAEKYGFHRPLWYEGWHLEPKMSRKTRLNIINSGEAHYKKTGGVLGRQYGMDKVETAQDDKKIEESESDEAVAVDKSDVSIGKEIAKTSVKTLSPTISSTPYQVSKKEEMVTPSSKSAKKIEKAISTQSDNTTNAVKEIVTNNTSDKEVLLKKIEDSTKGDSKVTVNPTGSSSTKKSFSKISDTQLLIVANEE